jgi:hypothetical protein
MRSAPVFANGFAAPNGGRPYAFAGGGGYYQALLQYAECGLKKNSQAEERELKSRAALCGRCFMAFTKADTLHNR